MNIILTVSSVRANQILGWIIEDIIMTFFLGFIFVFIAISLILLVFNLEHPSFVKGGFAGILFLIFLIYSAYLGYFGSSISKGIIQYLLERGIFSWFHWAILLILSFLIEAMIGFIVGKIKSKK